MKCRSRWQRQEGHHRGGLLLSRCCRTICIYTSSAMHGLHTIGSVAL